MTTAPPPRRVLEAFGVRGEPMRLTGGQGGSWLVGGLVLKSGVGAVTQEWLGTVVAPLPRTGFRLAEPVPSTDGRWVVDGWSATRYVPGVDAADHTDDWAAVVTAGRSFHAAVAALPAPAFLPRRTDPWARADRAAWSETDLPVMPAFAALVRRLQDRVEGAPDLGRPQVVHGDLTGNVLVAAGEDPLVLDVSPYWRPTTYAEGVVVADAVTWSGGDPGLAERLGIPRSAAWRALLFRILTSSERLRDHDDSTVLDLEVDRYRAAVATLGA